MKHIRLTILFLLVTAALHAASLKATVDHNPVQQGDVFRITFEHSGTGIDFEAPPFDGFLLMGGPQRSAMPSIIGNKVSSSESISYILQAVRTGKLVIPPAHIRINGHRVASNAVNITVVAAGRQRQAGKEGGEDIFLKTEVSEDNVFEGEGVIVKYYLYHTPETRVEGYTITRMASFDGFWLEESHKRDEPPTSENYKGKMYIKKLVRKIFLFPRKSGVLTVPPLEIETQGEKQGSHSSGFFPDDMFGFDLEPFHKSLKSNSVNISSRALPEAGKPAGFTGLVGKMALAATANTRDVKTSEPINYQVTLGGEGNIMMQQALKLALPDGMEAYDPKVTDNFDKEGDIFTGTRTFDYTLMPHKEGSFEIPVIKLSYFDPVKKTYEQTTVPAIAVTVRHNPNQSAAGTPAGGAAGAAHWGLYVLFAVALVLAGTALWFGRRKAKLQPGAENAGDPYEAVNYKDYLDEAAALIDNDDNSEFYACMLNAMYRFAEQELDIPFSDLTHESIREGFAAKNIPEAEARDFLNLLEACETIKFAPIALHQDKRTVYEKGKDVMGRIEGEAS